MMMMTYKDGDVREHHSDVLLADEAIAVEVISTIAGSLPRMLRNLVRYHLHVEH